GLGCVRFRQPLVESGWQIQLEHGPLVSTGTDIRRIWRSGRRGRSRRSRRCRRSRGRWGFRWHWRRCGLTGIPPVV
ncbi:unnamed protein product, partial [Closterium sp. NIES-53]